MYPGQDDQTRRMGQPDSRAYSQMGGDPGYDEPYANDAGYQERRAPRGPAIDMGKFLGSVAATALVAAIAGWLIAWVVDAAFGRFGHQWANGGNTPTMYAVYGAVAAILAGLLWYLLLVGTANPQQFFSWTVGLLIIAAVALPLLVTVPFLDGVAAAIVHLFIGLPILALTGAFAATLRR
ncbi:hypothetical protein H483_0108790 [Dietzia sp. UCD-THP]|uniref:Uncharacterized protein n=1 Tax=Dietzia natronolimnaea TaxID=161920 RepID=A0A2A2WR71_9ACTN|nr:MULTISPECIES: hypothetical protein [Dietzia]EYT63050.1 hypothetical protein H483_0108790 [Dietzia sp. UCD-THP]PAY23706.1 hypothetical protein CEY15_07395 [Dietzia natronolimnaea]